VQSQADFLHVRRPLQYQPTAATHFKDSDTHYFNSRFPRKLGLAGVHLILVPSHPYAKHPYSSQDRPKPFTPHGILGCILFTDSNPHPNRFDFESEVFTSHMPFLSPNQQHQSTEDKISDT